MVAASPPRPRAPTACSERERPYDARAARLLPLPSRARVVQACGLESEGGAGYGYAVVHDGGEDDARPLHETPFDRLEQARGFAVDWLAEQRAAMQRLAVVRLAPHSGRRDTVAIVDPASADVRSQLERRRSGDTAAG